MPPTTDDLLEADDELWQALVNHDAVALGALIDPEAAIDFPPLAGSDPHELLTAITAGTLRISAADLERRRLRIIGELGTTDAIVVVTGTYEGAPFRTRLRWIRTWRLAHAWTLVGSSTTAPPKERGSEARLSGPI